jgi:predicted Rdx family selenoprotein
MNFPEGVEVSGEFTPEPSAAFEVSVNGKLVHSKKGGQGFVDSKHKYDAIMAAVGAALAARKPAAVEGGPKAAS